MNASEFARQSVLPGGLEAGESVLAIGVAESFGYRTRRLMGGLQSAHGNMDATRPVERLVAITTSRLFELEVEVRGGKTRVSSLRELRFASCADVIVGGEGFDVGSPGAMTFAYRFVQGSADLIDAGTQNDFRQRAAAIVSERVAAARAAGPATSAPSLTSILSSPIDEPGFAAVVAEQARQSESSRLPVWIARGVAGVFGLIGLVFMVMKLDSFGSGSFFRAFCIGLFCMGIAAAAGVFSVVRDARAARASKLG